MKNKKIVIEISSAKATVRKHSLAVILHQKSSKSVYKQNSSVHFNFAFSKPRNNISYQARVSEENRRFQISLTGTHFVLLGWGSYLVSVDNS